MIHNKKFLTLFSGQTISNIGEQLYIIAIPWLIYEITQSTLTMGTVAAIIALPQIIFGLVVGVLIDKFNKRKVMVYSTLLQITLMCILPTMYYWGFISLNLIYIICFLYSLGSLVFLSTYRSAVPQLVMADDLIKANSYIQSSLTIIRVIGPMLAGILIANFGVHNVLYLNMVSFIFVLIALIAMRFPEEEVKRKKMEKSSIINEMFEGLKFIYSHKVIFHINILSFFVNIGMSMGLSMMVFYLHRDNFLSAEHVGYVFGISGGMAFLFSLLAPLVNRWFSQLNSIIISCSLAGVALTVISIQWHWVITGMLLGCITGGGTLASIYINTFIQKESPNHLIGRVFTTSQMLARVATPIAVFIGGWTTYSLISISQLFLMSGIIIVLSSLVVMIVLKDKKVRKVLV